MDFNWSRSLQRSIRSTERTIAMIRSDTRAKSLSTGVKASERRDTRKNDTGRSSSSSEGDDDGGKTATTTSSSGFAERRAVTRSSPQRTILPECEKRLLPVRCQSTQAPQESPREINAYTRSKTEEEELADAGEPITTKARGSMSRNSRPRPRRRRGAWHFKTNQNLARRVLLLERQLNRVIHGSKGATVEMEGASDAFASRLKLIESKQNEMERSMARILEKLNSNSSAPSDEVSTLEKCFQKACAALKQRVEDQLSAVQSNVQRHTLAVVEENNARIHESVLACREALLKLQRDEQAAWEDEKRRDELTRQELLQTAGASMEMSVRRFADNFQADVARIVQQEREALHASQSQLLVTKIEHAVRLSAECERKAVDSQLDDLRRRLNAGEQREALRQQDLQKTALLLQEVVERMGHGSATVAGEPSSQMGRSTVNQVRADLEAILQKRWDECEADLHERFTLYEDALQRNAQEMQAECYRFCESSLNAQKSIEQKAEGENVPQYWETAIAGFQQELTSLRNSLQVLRTDWDLFREQQGENWSDLAANAIADCVEREVQMAVEELQTRNDNQGAMDDVIHRQADQEQRLQSCVEAVEELQAAVEETERRQEVVVEQLVSLRSNAASGGGGDVNHTGVEMSDIVAYVDHQLAELRTQLQSELYE